MKTVVEFLGADPCWTDPGHVQPSEDSKWILSEDGIADITIYVDHAIRSAPSKTQSRRYGWLYEPASIVGGYSHIYEQHLNNFELVFTHSRSFAEGKDNVVLVPPGFPSWIKDRKIHKKNKLISMISTNKQYCKEHTIRYKLAKNLEQHPVVDVFGRGIKEIEKKEDGLNDYAFSIVVENDWSDLFYTEKLQDCFLTGTVPIYLGSKAVSEIFDEEGIIFLDHHNPVLNLPEYTMELYESKKDAIQNNFKLAKEKEMNIIKMTDLFLEEFIL